MIYPASRRFALQSIAKGALLVNAIGILGLMSACSDKKPEFKAVDITGADYAKDFALTDHNGQTRTLADFKGKVVVLFFGYTQCPDVCPTTMAELAEVKAVLAPYKSATLTADEAKLIKRTLRDAGLRRSPALDAALTAAGFNHAKLDQLDPPPPPPADGGPPPPPKK